MKPLVAALLVVVALGPQPGWAAACDYKPGETVRITGAYMPSRQAYARSFILGLQIDCGGSKGLVTVQQSTGRLPECKPDEQVEVVGKLTWNKFLMDGHYEIDNPSRVICLPKSAAAPPPQGIGERAPAQVPPLASATPSHAAASNFGPGVWVGRYQDSRGSGDVSFNLVRGVTTVSGTWKMRTGGGGPVTGLMDETGRRMQVRMENIAPECPGSFDGSAEISDTSMVVTYGGKDCQGTVTQGTLTLHPQ